MKFPQLLAAALTCASAHAQFDVDRRLVPPGDSPPVQGIPLDGLWAQQNFVGKDWPFGADELGYLGNARYIAGTSHLPDMQGTQLYHFGYSLFLLPAFWLFSDPVSTYRAVVVINALRLRAPRRDPDRRVLADGRYSRWPLCARDRCCVLSRARLSLSEPKAALIPGSASRP